MSVNNYHPCNKEHVIDMLQQASARHEAQLVAISEKLGHAPQIIPKRDGVGLLGSMHEQRADTAIIRHSVQSILKALQMTPSSIPPSIDKLGQAKTAGKWTAVAALGYGLGEAIKLILTAMGG